MKLDFEAREKLAAAIRARYVECAESYTEIGLKAGVHASQTSRICRGQFKTASHNVMQICKVLGIPLQSVKSQLKASVDQRRLEAAVVAVWDQSREDADRIVRVLKELRAFRAR